MPDLVENESRSTILDEIYRLLSPFKGETPIITEDTQLLLIRGLDSLGIMDMIMELEDRFDISIPMNRVDEIKTIADLADTILLVQGER